MIRPTRSAKKKKFPGGHQQVISGESGVITPRVKEA